jgi:hypothetical protein
MYDLKMNRVVSSVQFNEGVSMAKIDPWNTNNVVVASASGYIDVLEINEGSNGPKEREPHGIQVISCVKHRYAGQRLTFAYVRTA